MKKRTVCFPKQPITMLTTEAESDYHTLYHTGVKDEQGKELVLTCGYATDGKFGYFIIKQHTKGSRIIYSECQGFFQKTDEKTYQKALKYLQEQVSNKK